MDNIKKVKLSGKIHKLYPVETCPECGGRVLHCTCKALGTVDGMQLARRIEK